MSPNSPRSQPEQYLIAIQMAVATLENRCRREGHGDWTRHTELISASAACLAESAMADTTASITADSTTTAAASTTTELMESMAELLTQWRELNVSTSPDQQDDERLVQVRRSTDQCLRKLAGRVNLDQTQQDQNNNQLTAARTGVETRPQKQCD